MSEATYTRGMRNWSQKSSLHRVFCRAGTSSILTTCGTATGWHLLKSTALKRDESSDARYREQLEARGQQRLGIDPGTGEAA